MSLEDRNKVIPVESENISVPVMDATKCHGNRTSIACICCTYQITKESLCLVGYQSPA